MKAMKMILVLGAVLYGMTFTACGDKDSDTGATEAAAEE